ncbi:MAG: preprotein translocase subunit SecY [Clostridia bacterium]|nr:preprotein translocase subunit SecY [Clostridia bacterium]
MWQTIKNAFSDKSIRSRMFATFGILLAFRIGCWIPLPGISVDFYSAQFDLSNNSSQNTIFQLLSMMSGGSMQYLTLFALGILPFINSFIIMQLLTLIIPPLERLSKQGDEGREKITIITRYVAIVLAVVQAIGIVVAYKDYIDPMFGEAKGWLTAIMLIALLVAGSTVVMWLGERITELGIGNGTSLIIFSGILSSFGLAMVNTIPQIKTDTTKIWNLLGYIVVVLLLFLFIVFVDGGERRIKVNYAKQVKGNKMYGGQSTFIPIKVNSSGVMPIIFASSFMTIPMMIFQFVGQDSQHFNNYMIFCYPGTSTNQWQWVGWVFYYLVMLGLIIFFAYFYAQIQFNPQDVARNLQQYGGTIQGIRGGKPTSDYLAKINNKIVLFGALFLGFIAIIPAALFQLLGNDLGLTNAISSTGMLIAVSVALEFNKQLEGQLMMKHYKGFLK